MIVPKGTDAHPYTLTEPRELVLRCIATEAAQTALVPGTLARPVTQPLPLTPRVVDQATAWLHEHGYLDATGPTPRGWQVAEHLSRADRHDPIVDPCAVPDPDQDGRLVPGSRVRCTCEWGGTRLTQGPARLRVPYPPHRGGREAAERLHAPHAREMRGEPEPKPLPKRNPFAGAATTDDGDDW